MNKQVICAGQVGEGVTSWLYKNGATVDGALGIDLFKLPENARIEQDGRAWRYLITLPGYEGNAGDQYVEMELSPNAMQTVLTLKTV
jgi:hypothetical protein